MAPDPQTKKPPLNPVPSGVEVLYLRKKPVEIGPHPETEKERPPIFPPEAIIVALRLVGATEGDPPTQALVGVAFCSGKKEFSRKKGRTIALHRLAKSPLSIDAGNEEMTSQLVITILRTLMLDPPKWVNKDDIEILNPDRFSHRIAAEVIGPDGLLVEVSTDVRMRRKLGDVVELLTGPPRPMHKRMNGWALRFPLWAIAFMEEITP